jgi:membrane protease YdiL (CAAX protease family)
MQGFTWHLFGFLVGMGVFAVACSLPYVFTINRDKMAQAPLSPRILVVVSIVQGGVMMAVTVGIGLLAMPATGLDLPLFKAALEGGDFGSGLIAVLPLAVIIGALAGTTIVLLDAKVFNPRLPDALKKADQPVASWKRWLASFYGGIGEELLMRLFLMTALAWLLSRVWTGPDGLAAVGAIWVANVLAAVIFGLGHLPVTAAMAPLTPAIVVRAVALNGIGGIAFGWMYWQHGLLAAMIAHYAADLVLHIVMPYLAQRQQPVDAVPITA